MKRVFLLFVIACLTFGCKSNGKDTQKDNIVSNQKDWSNAKIGDIGQADGIIFRIDRNNIWEVSEKLGVGNWERAKTLCKEHRGGNHDDWHLPTKEELNWVYESLIKTKKIKDEEYYWSSTEEDKDNAVGHDFKEGLQYGSIKTYEDNSVRAVRSFKVSGK